MKNGSFFFGLEGRVTVVSKGQVLDLNGIWTILFDGRERLWSHFGWIHGCHSFSCVCMIRVLGGMKEKASATARGRTVFRWTSSVVGVSVYS